MFGCITAQPRRRPRLDPRLDDGASHFQRSFSERAPASRPPLRTTSLRDRGGHSTPPPLPPHRASDQKNQKTENNKREKEKEPAGGMRRLDRWIGHLMHEGGSSRNAVVDQRAGGWQYADEVRVSVAPLAAAEDDEPHRPRPSRGCTVLQTLREQKDFVDYSERRRQASTLPASSSVRPPPYRQPEAPFRSRDPYRDDDPYLVRPPESLSGRPQLDEMNVVFLQANDEVKRTILPPDVVSMDQVKMAFVRAFPNITRHFIDLPHVKVYIQEQSRGQLFYELDDPRDIKNKSVLKLREQTSMNGMQSPARFLEHPDYHSETEHDDGRHRFISIARPASAMAHMNPVDFGPPKPLRQKSFDPYLDPYSSDTSSHDSRSVTRSGSATPVIDRESRARMETMERQLAGLSSLVHSALVSKGMSESTQRDMADLRSQILALHPETVREASEEPSSLPDSISSHTHHQLGALRHRVQQANTEMRQLRRTAQVNAQSARTLIKEAGDQIATIISERSGSGGGSRVSDSSLEERERDAHAQRLAALLDQLTEFEQNVETVRNSVLQSNKKLRMSEVEGLTEGLTQIGRNAAALKTEFPPIQAAIESRIKADMERIVREEKFIRDQTAAVDQSLRRCKALANIMVTMKKLAMVQDPAIHRTKKEHSSTSSSPLPPMAPNQNHAIAHPPAPVHAPADPAFERPAVFTPNVDVRSPPQLPALAPPPVPPTPSDYNSSTTSLDGVLQEVGQPGMPPRPPSRFSVLDVRTKFTKPPELPEQIKSLIEDVARRASPAPERDVIADRRQDLEDRQERLAEKQRQLRTQFQQLQQLTPLP